MFLLTWIGVIAFSDLICGLGDDYRYPVFAAFPDEKMYSFAKMVMSDPEKNTSWHAGYPFPKEVIYLTRYDKYIFHLNCAVEPLYGPYQLTEVKFCFTDTKNKWNNYACETLTLSRRYAVIRLNPKAKISPTAVLNFDPRAGGLAVYKSSGSLVLDESFQFHCVVKNKLGSIQSNTMRYLDFGNIFRKHRRHKQSYRPQIPLETNKKFLYLLSEDIDMDLFPEEVYGMLTKWYLCEDDNQVLDIPCRKSKNLFDLRDLIHGPSVSGEMYGTIYMQVNHRGDLVAPAFHPKITKMLRGKRFFHERGSERDRVFTNIFKFVSKPMEGSDFLETFKNLIYVFSPKYLLYNNFVETCSFSHGIGISWIEWFVRNPASETGSEAPMDKNAFTSPKSQVKLKTTLMLMYDSYYTENAMDEFYICKMGHRAHPTAKKTFYKQVVIRFVRDVDPVGMVKFIPENNLYVVDGKDANATCSVKGLYTLISTDVRDTPVVSINGVVMGRNVMMTTLSSVVIPFKTDWATSDSSADHTKVVSLFYHGHKLRYKDHAGRSGTHQLQCGRQRQGVFPETHGGLVVNVLPKPSFGVLPSDYQCIPCSSEWDHILRCEILNPLYFESDGLKIYRSWSFGGNSVTNLGKFSHYFSPSEVDDSIKIRKFLNKDFQQFLFGGNITCHIRIYRDNNELWNSDEDYPYLWHFQKHLRPVLAPTRLKRKSQWLFQNSISSFFAL